MKTYFAGLLLALSLPCLAQTSHKYGDWAVVKVERVTVASTSNDSGSVIGYLCLDDTCGPYLAVSMTCEEKVVTPVLINSPAGAFHATTTCTSIGSSKYLLINEVEDFNRALEGGGDIGFAFPMQSGKFQVSRFSTAGAVPAIKDAMQLSREKRSTKLRSDETL